MIYEETEIIAINHLTNIINLKYWLVVVKLSATRVLQIRNNA